MSVPRAVISRPFFLSVCWLLRGVRCTTTTDTYRMCRGSRSAQTYRREHTTRCTALAEVTVYTQHARGTAQLRVAQCMPTVGAILVQSAARDHGGSLLPSPCILVAVTLHGRVEHRGDRSTQLRVGALQASHAAVAKVEHDGAVPRHELHSGDILDWLGPLELGAISSTTEGDSLRCGQGQSAFPVAFHHAA